MVASGEASMAVKIKHAATEVPTPSCQRRARLSDQLRSAVISDSCETYSDYVPEQNGVPKQVGAFGLVKDANEPKLGEGESDVASVAPGFNELEGEDEEGGEGGQNADHSLRMQLPNDGL